MREAGEAQEVVQLAAFLHLLSNIEPTVSADKYRGAEHLYDFL